MRMKRWTPVAMMIALAAMAGLAAGCDRPSAAAEKSPPPAASVKNAAAAAPKQPERGEVVVSVNKPDREDLQGTYGAIALAPAKGAVIGGVSYRAADRAVAERAALEICRSQAADNHAQLDSACDVQLWFSQACGAIAANDDGAWGTGWGNGRVRACAEAKAVCDRYGRNCKGFLYTCSPSGEHGTCDGSLTSY